ncbi:MAG: beta-L-arabinofuranosidase domain-containing protein, partial [Bacteroidaceae bacterium]
GMASSSILEPVMLLYRRTMNKKYLDFAKFIVSDWEQNGGPQLIAKANVPVGRRFPVKGATQWWTRDNGQKAYEMMSCYVGLLELYKVTHNEDYLKTVETVVRHIMDEEINICGSGAAFECWYGGNKRQTRPAYNSMETCVTFTWMQLNERLLQITGNPLYADNIENTAYNALLAAMKGDASQIAKYTPLEGFRHQGGNQCGLNINCCNANAPRAFAMIPRVAYMTRGADSIEINLYSPSTAQIQLGKNMVELQMATNYPVTDSIEITINPQHVGKFNLCLRIPEWSQKTNLFVNGQKVQNITSGSYCTLNRTWQKGDKITLQLDLRTRLYELNGMQALKRGPITLARDSRFQDGTVDETAIIQANNGFVDAQPVAPQQGMWMAFTVPIVMGTDQENFGTPRAIHFCDFASAGNSWDQQQRYRVWLTKTIDPTIEPQ